MKKTLTICVVMGGTMLLGVAAYFTMLYGTKSGPDFIAALQSGCVQVKDVRSVEVTEPPNGHMPFSRAEYDVLARKFVLEDRTTITQFLDLIAKCSSSGWVTQNHPIRAYNMYCKINMDGADFYYLYVTVDKDESGEVCYVESNTRNATNPNGARLFRAHDVDALLARTTADVAK